MQTAIVAAEEATELETIEVERGEQPVSELPLGIGVSADTLSDAPGSGGDPLRGLQSLPGMVFTDDSTAEPAVRGSRPGDNFYQTDFTRSGYIFHSGGAISVYNGDLIESFNIYPSAFGPEFSGINGGVFDIVLRDPRNERLQTTIDLSVLQAGFLVEGPVADNQSFYFAARRSYLDLFLGDVVEEDGVTFNDFPNYSDYQGKYVWRVNDDSVLRFSVNGATDDLDIDITDEAEGVASDPIFIGNVFEETRFNKQSVVWDKNINDRLSLKSALAHVTEATEVVAGGAGSVDTKTDITSIKSTLTYDLSDTHQLKAGVELENADVSFDIDFNAPQCSEFEAECLFTGAERLQVTEDTRVRLLNAFIKDSWSVTDQLTLYPGVAFHSEDYLDKQFVEPRIALEYAVSDDLMLTAGFGINHQMPAIDEINEVFGNPELEYIEALHASIGVNKEFTDGWSVRSELYLKELDNLVTSDDDLRYTNQGEGRSLGLDTLLRKRMTDKISGWLSVSLSDSERTDKRSGEVFDFEYDQPINVSLVSKYDFSPRWAVSAKLWAHSGSPYTPVLGATEDPDIDDLYIPEYGELNSDRLPTFSRLDIRLDRYFQHKNGRKSTGYIEFLNLTGSKNISGYSYNADYSERTAVEQLPSFMAFGFKTSF